MVDNRCHHQHSENFYPGAFFGGTVDTPTRTDKKSSFKLVCPAVFVFGARAVLDSAVHL